jgi:hypothetical protein
LEPILSLLTIPLSFPSPQSFHFPALEAQV